MMDQRRGGEGEGEGESERDGIGDNEERERDRERGRGGVLKSSRNHTAVDITLNGKFSLNRKEIQSNRLIIQGE